MKVCSAVYSDSFRSSLEIRGIMYTVCQDKGQGKKNVFLAAILYTLVKKQTSLNSVVLISKETFTELNCMPNFQPCEGDDSSFTVLQKCYL